MSHALIGHTGFIGANLARQHAFAACFNSTNIESIAGAEFDLLVCAGARAEKWKANADPIADRRGIERLLGALDCVTATRVALISTVDVFVVPNGVDELTVVDTTGLQPYGANRRMLEEALSARFDTTTLRLPGCYGTGLKKNIIYDFQHHNELHKIDSRGVFQFYGVDRLWRDVELAVANGLELVHLATEPTSVHEIAAAAFGMTFENHVTEHPARYDIQTRYAERFGGTGRYVEPREEVLRGIRRYVA
jgi:nucleoside-diphosphate-sugar epimerase